MSESIRILIADDHPLFRDGVIHSLSKELDIEIVGQAINGKEALHLTRELLPDAILLDITMPDGDGLTAAAQIAAACPVTKIIMLTVSEHEDDLLAAFKAGARGYALKGVSGRRLAKVIRAVVAGEVYVSPILASDLLMELSHPPPPDPLNELTKQERYILELVSEGLTNREIGEKLYLTEKTIKYHMTNVFQKLQVRSRVQAALLAQKRRFEDMMYESGKTDKR